MGKLSNIIQSHRQPFFNDEFIKKLVNSYEDNAEKALTLYFFTDPREALIYDCFAVPFYFKDINLNGSVNLFLHDDSPVVFSAGSLKEVLDDSEYLDLDTIDLNSDMPFFSAIKKLCDELENRGYNVLFMQEDTFDIILCPFFEIKK